MRRYLIRRLLLFVPMLVALVLLAFLLLRSAPGDPVQRMMTTQVSGEALQGNEVLELEQRRYWMHRLGLDLPVFYVSVLPAGEQGLAKWIPFLEFHGRNQFHRWLFGDGMYTRGIVHGDFGISYVSKQPVSALLAGRIRWTVLLTFFSVVLSYLFSIPAGIYAAANPGSRFDRVSSFILTLLYSLPVFWVAVLLLMTFSNPDVMNVLPQSGVGPTGGFDETISWWHKIRLSIPYLILPTICYTYGSLAFLSRTMRVTVVDTLLQDYIRTARAKGLSEHQILWKHALRNALLPLITVFSHVFPVAISGSVILESIFTIPGMGLTLYQSIDAQDYPVILAVFTWTGVITMLGFLLSDILYAQADPRISFSKQAST